MQRDDPYSQTPVSSALNHAVLTRRLSRAGCYYMKGYPEADSTHQCKCGQAEYDACSLPGLKSEGCESCCADPAEATFIKDPEP